MVNKGYNTDWLESLKFNNDIVSVIGKYVTLNQKGKTHWGCCPFHNEKTPSFAVNQVEGYYKCFGCGESGDVISFVQKYESIDFIDAIKILADFAGMEVPQYSGDNKVKENKEKRDLIYKANKEAAIFYNKTLFTEKGKAALNYLYKRGLNNETINKFGLGASPDWTSLVTYLKQKGFSLNDLAEADLIKKGNNGFYDTMAERLMFPIQDSYGNVLGFSGRALEDGKFAKYKNTAQTLAFDKSKIVYGINLLKKLKNTEGLKEVIVVEGQMDSIALHNSGFANVVGTMGTALTKFHAKQLKRFADKVLISFDGDPAGQKAALRSLDILNEEGLSVYVITIPNNMDPDEFIKKNGSDAYKTLVKNAMPLNDYKIETLASGFNLNDNNQVQKFLKLALETIANIKEASERDVYLKILERKVKIDFNTLERELRLVLSGVTSEEVSVEDKKDKKTKASEFVLSSILHKQPFVKAVGTLEFNNLIHKKLYEFILNQEKLGKVVKVSTIYDHFDTEKNKDLQEIMHFNFDKIKEPEKYFDDCVNLLKKVDSKQRQQQIMSEIAKATTPEEKAKLLKELQQLIKQTKN